MVGWPLPRRSGSPPAVTNSIRSGSRKKDPFEHGHVDPVALTGVLARAERGEDADDAVQRGGAVAHRGARAHGRAVGIAGHAADPAHRLHHRVESTPLAIGSALAETGDRAQDQPGICGLEHREPESHCLKGARQEVLHEHVGAGGEAQEELDARRLAQIQRDALLAAHPMQHGEAEVVVRTAG